MYVCMYVCMYGLIIIQHVRMYVGAAGRLICDTKHKQLRLLVVGLLLLVLLLLCVL